MEDREKSLRSCSVWLAERASSSFPDELKRYAKLSFFFFFSFSSLIALHVSGENVLVRAVRLPTHSCHRVYHLLYVPPSPCFFFFRYRVVPSFTKATLSLVVLLAWLPCVL
jgi:hypothetical protein